MNKMKGIVCILNALMLAYAPHILAAPQSPLLKTDQEELTSSAILTLNWLIKEQRIKKDNGVILKIPKTTYQLTLPFTQYKTDNESTHPANNYVLQDHYNFSLHYNFSPNALGDKAGNKLIKWEGLTSDVNVSFIPVPDAAESRVNLPQHVRISTLNSPASMQPSYIKVYKPITLLKNNKRFAEIDEINVEKIITTEDNLMSVTVNGSFNEVNFVTLNKKYGPGQFSLYFEKLDKNVQSQIEQTILNQKNLSADEKLTAQLGILSQLPALYKNGAQVTGIFSLQTPSGRIENQYTIDLSSLVVNTLRVSKIIPFMLGLSSLETKKQLAVELPFSIMDALKGHDTLSLPKQDFIDFMQIIQSGRFSYRTPGSPALFSMPDTQTHAHDILRALVAGGLYEVNGEQCVADIDFDNGQLFSHNKTFDIYMNHS